MFVALNNTVTTAYLNLHFQNLEESDSIILHYPVHGGGQDSTIFLHEKEKPVTVTFEHHSNSLNGKYDYLIVDVPNQSLRDTLLNIAEKTIDNSCREDDITKISLEKDGQRVGPDETIDIYY